MDRREFLQLAGIGMASAFLTACGGTEEQASVEDEVVEETVPEAEAESEQESAEPESESEAAAASPIVAYFSWSGNTAGMATRIADITGGQLFELVPVDPYPEVYEDCTDEALAEQRAGTLRAYQGDVEGWDAASVVYLGYPIWWMDLPQIVKKFIDDHDWTDKTVVPFSTYYSSGWAGTPQSNADTCVGATVADGLSLAQGDLPGAYDDIDGWLASLVL